MSWESKQVLITGGAGFIGSHLTERLLKENCKVVIIDDLSTSSRQNLSGIINHPALTFIEAKVSECSNLAGIVAESDFIYHLAAAVGVELVVNEPIRTLETNLRETEVILATAVKSKTPLLITSTSEVYGKSQKEAFTETDDLIIGPPYLGRWRYACSKLMDEFLGLAYCEQEHLPVIIARLFNTVGPRQTGRYGMVLPRFIAAALDGKPLEVYGDGAQTRCFCYVADTVEALLRLGQCPEAIGQIFNIGANQECSITFLAQKVIALLSSQSKIIRVPYDKAYAPGFEDMMRRKPFIEKLSRTIQFTPQTALDEIIQITARHLQTNR